MAGGRTRGARGKEATQAGTGEMTEGALKGSLGLGRGRGIMRNPREQSAVKSVQSSGEEAADEDHDRSGLPYVERADAPTHQVKEPMQGSDMTNHMMQMMQMLLQTQAIEREQVRRDEREERERRWKEEQIWKEEQRERDR